MSLWSVKRHDGKFLCFDDFSDPHWDEVPDIFDKGEAESLAEDYRGHVVELDEKPAPVVVSAEEAEMLEQAKCDDDPAELIVGFVNSHDKYDDDSKAEDRLMRAYVIGWVVAKPKRYLVYKRLPGKLSSDSNDSIQAHKVKMTQGLVWRFVNKESLDTDDYFQFTDAEIEQYGLQNCEKVEVKP